MILRLLTTAALLAASALAPLPASAGPLTPPAGPVAPTHKTLSEVEPRIPLSQATTPGDDDAVFVITNPGSYYLTGNLNGQAGKAGIEIHSGSVTIDLGGFFLNGGGGSLDAIRTGSPDHPSIAITNGTIAAWGGDGIDFATEAAPSCRIEGVSVGFCGRSGILAGASAVVTGCTARSNGASGVLHAAGISGGPGSTISLCTAEANTGYGIVGLPGTTITGCAARSNTGDGFRVANGSTVTACSAHSNGSVGINAPAAWLVQPLGVMDGNGVTVSGCSVSGNALFGIRVNADGTVSGCTARNNGTGIGASSNSTILGNTCASNTGAGIAVSAGNTLDGNTCIDNGTKGIEVTLGGNLIIRNRCAANATGDWSITPNNRLGPIVLSNVNTTQINGATAPGSLTTADPFANITY